MLDQMMRNFDEYSSTNLEHVRVPVAARFAKKRRGQGSPIPVTSHDLAWAAGMVDGEGSISVVRQTYQADKRGNKRNPTMRLKLVIVQNDWSTLNRLKKIIGGKCYLNELPLHESHNRQVFQLQWDGINALGAINKLAPYIYRKKQYVYCANMLWNEGAMGTRPGRKGLSPNIISAREKWVARIRKLK